MWSRLFARVHVCVTVWMGVMLSKNMCYGMAKFANKHDDRLQCRKLFRLLIDSWPFGVCHFQASPLSRCHILFTYFTAFLLLFSLPRIPLCDNNVPTIWRKLADLVCCTLRLGQRLWPASAHSVAFSLKRAIFDVRWLILSWEKKSQAQILCTEKIHRWKSLVHSLSLTLSRVLSTTNRVWK